MADLAAWGDLALVIGVLAAVCRRIERRQTRLAQRAADRPSATPARKDRQCPGPK